MTRITTEMSTASTILRWGDGDRLSSTSCELYFGIAVAIWFKRDFKFPPWLRVAHDVWKIGWYPINARHGPAPYTCTASGTWAWKCARIFDICKNDKTWFFGNLWWQSTLPAAATMFSRIIESGSVAFPTSRRGKHSIHHCVWDIWSSLKQRWVFRSYVTNGVDLGTTRPSGQL